MICMSKCVNHLIARMSGWVGVGVTGYVICEMSRGCVD